MNVHRTLREDRGSVLILSLGFIVVCIIAVAVVVDASTVFLARRALQAQADAAALAGAQAIDIGEYYANGASPRIRLDPAAVGGAVRGHVQRAEGGAHLDGVSLRDQEVVVRMSDSVRPPFSGWLTPGGRHTLAVEAGATLTYRTGG